MAADTGADVPGAKSNGSINQTSRDTYVIDTGPGRTAQIKFHSGAIDGGLNGVTVEQLLRVCFLRLQAMQAEVFSGETGGAFLQIDRAMRQLQQRTAARIARGVEGTKQA